MRGVLCSTKTKPADYAKIACIDVETINRIEAYAIALYDGTRQNIWHGRRCLNEALNEILTKKYRGWIFFAHNGGNFDFQLLYDILFEQGYQLMPIMQSSKIVELRIKKNKHLWVLKDSMGFFKTSLKKLAQTIPGATQKGEFDHKKVTWNNYESLMPEWQPYLLKDVKSLHEIMTAWEKRLVDKEHISTKNASTMARLSMQAYRRNHLDTVLPTYVHAEPNIRKAYTGGRVEKFKNTIKNAYCYDVNSLYPYVMKTYDMPVGRPIHSANISTQDYGFAYAVVKAPKDIHIPILAHKNEAGKLLFPTGTFDGWWATPELEYARINGYQIEIIEGYKFAKKNLFATYVNHYYAQKNQAKKGSLDYDATKLFMCSLYGKFGQKRTRRKIISNPQDLMGWESQDKSKKLYIRNEHSEANHILPGISAMVTSYGRITLHQLATIAGHRNIAYMDTDSLMTTTPMPTSDALGALKLEYNILEGVFLGAKAYALKTDKCQNKLCKTKECKHKLCQTQDCQEARCKEIVRVKGFPTTSTCDTGWCECDPTKPHTDLPITYDEIKATLAGDHILIRTRTRIAPLLSSLRHSGQSISIIRQSRSIKAKYDKRTMLEDGESTPLCINTTTKME